MANNNSFSNWLKYQSLNPTSTSGYDALFNYGGKAPSTATQANGELLSAFISRGGDIKDPEKPINNEISSPKAIGGAFSNIANNADDIVSNKNGTPMQSIGGFVVPGVTAKNSGTLAALKLLNSGFKGLNLNKELQQKVVDRAKAYQAMALEQRRKEELASEEKERDRENKAIIAQGVVNGKSDILDKQLEAKQKKEDEKKEAELNASAGAIKILNRSIPELNDALLTANKYGYIGTEHSFKRGILDNQANGKYLTGSLLAHGFGGYGITDDDRKGYNALRAIEQIKLGEVTRNIKAFFTGKVTNMELDLLNKSYFDRSLSFEDNVKNIKNVYYSVLDKLSPEAAKKYSKEIGNLTNLIETIGTEPVKQTKPSKYLVATPQELKKARAILEKYK